MASVPNVQVSIETVCESQIQEVTLDGQEIYTQPLSMSENLTKLAHKIDFSQDEASAESQSKSESEKNAEKEQAKTQPSLWPWDSVRTKLKSSLTEVSVLADVLGIAREKRYMVLDPVQSEPTEQRPAAQLMAKKKSLQSAANILLEGAEKLKKSEIDKSAAHSDFNKELMELRQRWKLKKVGNTILGDLSYKSAGSRYWQSGTFEVRKKEADTITDSPMSNPSGSTLEVIIPSELEGVAYVQVSVEQISDLTEVTSAYLTLPSHASSNLPHGATWRHKLKAAQNVLFCKELFSQLAREAVQIKSPIPILVVGNKIVATLFPGVQLCITLCHFSGKDKDKKDKMPPAINPEHRYVLEHSLHQLLREIFFANINHSMPHPVTATIGMTKRRRLAGPQGCTSQDLLDMIQTETLLEKIIKQAQHAELRLSTANTVDELCLSVPDPQITAHWGAYNEALESTVKISITSMAYETYRTVLSLVVGTDNVKAVNKDGRSIQLSYEQQELKDFLLSQLSQHQVLVIQSLTKFLGWQVLSTSLATGIGEMEKCGNTSSLLLTSPTASVQIAIRSGPTLGQKVYIQTLPQKPTDQRNKDIVTDVKWVNLGGDFQEIDIDKIEGKTFLDRLDLIMASYNT